MEVWGRQEEASASQEPKARKQGQMNGNGRLGNQNKLGKGRREELYP